MKTPFIFMRGIYSNDQVGSYMDCLRLLKGKTNFAVVYGRQINNFIDLLPDLVQCAESNGIQLIGGIELAACLRQGEKYPLMWDWLWYPEGGRWGMIAEYTAEISEITGTKEVALVHEPAINGFYNGETVDWSAMMRCYAKVYAKGIIPWIDVPILYPDDPVEWPKRQAHTERYVTTLAKSFSFWSLARWSKARWMCGYAFDPANDARLRARHKSIVGPSSFYERIFSCIHKEKPSERDVAETKSIIAANTGLPIVVYAKFVEGLENGTALCEAL